MIKYKPTDKNLRAALCELINRVPGFNTVHSSSSYQDPSNITMSLDDLIYSLVGKLQSVNLISFLTDFYITEEPKGLTFDIHDPTYPDIVTQQVLITAGAVWFTEYNDVGFENFMGQICSVDSDVIADCILACRENGKHYNYADIIGAITQGKDPNELDPLSVGALVKLFVNEGVELRKAVRNSYRSLLKRLPTDIPGVKERSLSLEALDGIGQCVVITYELPTHTAKVYMPDVQFWGKYRGALGLYYKSGNAMFDSTTFYIDNGGMSNVEQDAMISTLLTKQPTEIIEQWKLTTTQNTPTS